MGYDRNDRWSQDNRYGRDRGGSGRPGGAADRDDRGFLDRAGDEVRSWFGDEEAERRRGYDERHDDRYRAERERDDRSGRYGAQDQDRGRRTHGGESNGQVYGYGGASSWNAGRDRGQDAGGQGWSEPSRGRQRPDAGDEHPHDANYRSWRDRQMAAFDRDYHDYRRENQSKFETEFSGYRTQRQGQRDLLGQVREHQEVVGSDGQHVGKVDHVRGDRIRLAKNDQAAGGHHHSIPSSWIRSVDEKVTISKTAEEAKRAWRDEDADQGGGGLFGQRDNRDRDAGRTNLDRSFSGTY